MKKRNLKLYFSIIATVLIVLTFTAAFRAGRMAMIGADLHRKIRYLTENGETVGEQPAVEALSVDYLQSIFGDNEELLNKLKGLVQRGLSDAPSLNLGEVAAMMVTYHRDDEGGVRDVCAYVIGNFPAGRRKLGMHRDGYLRQQLDPRLWMMGNTAVSFVGRDMVLFAEEDVLETQQQIMESVFAGDIMYLVEQIDDPLYFSLVLPDPRRVIPSLLRNHVQAVVIKGFLAPDEGRLESIILTPSSKSAGYVLSNINDYKRLLEVSLRTKWKGVLKEREWGGIQNDMWWAYELANASETTTLERQYNIVRIRSNFERPMVNVVLKGIERMGRDVAGIRGTLAQKLDPRLVQARLKNSRSYGYWSKQHQWGPNWPIAPREDEEAVKTAEAAVSTPENPPADDTEKPAPTEP